MNPVTVETTIDVTILPPRHKHPTILKAWTDLENGGALLLLNDHDPLPLYYQFACEFKGQFQWEYLDRGPDLWRVRISKGDFADPGFVPSKTAAPAPVSVSVTPAPRVLDTRPIFAQAQSPCDAIDAAAATLLPGQSLVLLVPFEPLPLYVKFESRGFHHQSEQLSDGTWRVEFQR